MKIYTRTGDQGTTGLFGGARVHKTHARIMAYGTVDELNAFLGQSISALTEQEADGMLRARLTRIQAELFVVGADLATPLEAKPWVPRVGEEMVKVLEHEIDAMEADLSPLQTFILPGGSSAGSALHVARTVCRRAERETVDAAGHETVNEFVIVYLNRLSDWLFVAARWINHAHGAPETPWMPARP